MTKKRTMRERARKYVTPEVPFYIAVERAYIAGYRAGRRKR